MKYLISELQLGMIIEATRDKRVAIAKKIINIQYLTRTGSNNDDNIKDCIKLNKM